MYAATLLADPTCLRLERIISSAISLTLVVRTIGPNAACPRCGAISGRVHSRYRRSVADLPWHGVAARPELHARKFFCVGLDCPRRVFTERLPRVVAPHARRTRRLNEALTLLAFALGGEASAGAAAGLGMAAGADALLARIRGAALPERPTPAVLGGYGHKASGARKRSCATTSRTGAGVQPNGEGEVCGGTGRLARRG